MGVVLGNNAHTTLSANVSSTDTVIYVASVSSFPTLDVNEYFNCTIESTSGAYEIVRVTQVNTGSFNVTRGQEGTLAVPFNIGARVELRVTVQNLEDQIEDIALAHISDDSFSSGWNAQTDVSPSQNAVYDKFVSMETVDATKVTGPSSATDSHLVAFDGTTGKLVKSTGVTVAGLTPNSARISRYGTNDAAATAAKNAAGPDGVIYIDTDVTFTGSVSFEGYEVRFEGGTITPAASPETVTFDSTPDAGPRQIFTGANKNRVRFSKQVVACLEWWGGSGDGIVDNAAAISAALASMHVEGGVIELYGTYRTTETMNIGDGNSTTLSSYSSFKLRGVGGGGVGEGEIGAPRGEPRIVYDGVVPSAKTITGATQANPCVVTSASHGFTNGQTVLISHVAGMVELNCKAFIVANATANTFELSGIDATGFTAYTSGGVAILEAPVVRINGPFHSLHFEDLVFDTDEKATVGIKASLPYNVYMNNVTVENCPAYARGARFVAYPAALPAGFTQGAMHGLLEQFRVRTHRSDYVVCSIEFAGDDKNNVGCSRWTLINCDALIGGAAGTYGYIFNFCDKVKIIGGMTAWSSATHNGNSIGLIGSTFSPGFPHENDTDLTTMQGGWAIISGTPGYNTSTVYPTNDNAPIPSPLLNVFGSTSDGRWFGPARTFSFGTKATAADLLIFKPSDWGTNKPGLFISNSATTGRYDIALWDGSDNDGLIGFSTPIKPISITGTTTNDSAPTGAVGEYIESEVTSASVSLTTATPADITSISLTAGDWDVWGSAFIIPNAATSVTELLAWVSTTSATTPSLPNKGGMQVLKLPFTTGTSQAISTGVRRISLAATTTVYLSCMSAFTTNTNAAGGFIAARRVR